MQLHVVNCLPKKRLGKSSNESPKFEYFQELNGKYGIVKEPFRVRAQDLRSAYGVKIVTGKNILMVPQEMKMKRTSSFRTESKKGSEKLTT